VRTDRRRLTGFVADALAIDWLMWADDEVVTTMIRRGPLIVSFHRRQPVIVSLIRLYGEWPAGICTSVLFINSMEALSFR
jgi:Na+-translocating ferredoxin:NAD+ oxidoreductase RnfD subunit